MEKNNSPLVSIVLITYNSSKFVLETLKSVEQQTWSNLELVISDDGSTDNTVELCAKWLEENKSRFISSQLITVSKNTGIPANCNRGLRAVKGEWVKTISGDDILLRNCISDNMEYVQKNPRTSFIASNVIEINEKGELVRDNVFNEGLVFFYKLPSAKKQLKAYIRWPAFLNTPTFFCSLDVIKKIGYCDESFKIYEDMTMLIRAFDSGFKLCFLNKNTVAYRIHQNAISRNTQQIDRREKEALQVFKKYRKGHLSMINLFDLSIYYENWLRFKYKGINGRKGISFLRKFSLYYWYMRFIGIQSY